LLAASAHAAAFAGGAGVSPQELLSGTAINAAVLDPEGGASQGGTAMRSLLASLGRLRSGTGAAFETDEEGRPLTQKAAELRAGVHAGLSKAGPGLLGQLEAIEKLRLDPGQLFTAFGRKEAVTAYSTILANRRGFTASLADQAEASHIGLFGKTMALTGADPQLAAAHDVRRQQAGAEEASGFLGTEENAIQSVFAHQRARQMSMGQTARAAFGRVMEEDLFPFIPGARRAAAQRLITGHALDDDKALLYRSVQALGGENAVYGGGDTEGRAAFERAAAAIERAAEKMAGNRPTLGTPNHDPGVPVSH